MDARKRSNRAIEGNNCFAKEVMKEKRSGRKTFDKWLENVRSI